MASTLVGVVGGVDYCMDMPRAAVSIVLATWMLCGCSDRADCVRAAAPHLQQFEELKRRSHKLIEFRTDLEQRRAIAKAFAGDEHSLPTRLRPLFDRMRQERAVVTDKEVAQREASFWRMFDVAFIDTDRVLQAELAYVEEDESITAFRHPREREVPAGLRWHGLRQPRTFCALAECLVEDGTESCVLVQLRPRGYAGSAGLTVGFEREP